MNVANVLYGVAHVIRRKIKMNDEKVCKGCGELVDVCCDECDMCETCCECEK